MLHQYFDQTKQVQFAALVNINKELDQLETLG